MVSDVSGVRSASSSQPAQAQPLLGRLPDRLQNGFRLGFADGSQIIVLSPAGPDKPVQADLSIPSSAEDRQGSLGRMLLVFYGQIPPEKGALSAPLTQAQKNRAAAMVAALNRDPDRRERLTNLKDGSITGTAVYLPCKLR
jgi:hypothetical protein